MKILNLVLLKSTLLLFALALSFGSCSNDEDSMVSEENDFGLTANLDGVEFSLENVTVSAFNGITGVYTINALEDSSNSTISFILPSPSSEGTYTAAIGEPISLVYQTIDPFVIWAVNEDVGTGTITISKDRDTYMEGTFSFTGINQADNTMKEITDGKFKAKKL